MTLLVLVYFNNNRLTDTAIHNKLTAQHSSVCRDSDSVDRSVVGSMDGSVVDRGVVGVHSNDGSWADPGVVADHVGGVGHALADLVALGGDDLLAVLDGRHVNMLSTHSPGHSPGSVCWDLLALFDRDGVTDRLGDLGRGLVDLSRSGVGEVGSNEGGIGLSCGLGLSLTQVMRGGAHHSLGRADQTTVVRSTVSHSDGSAGSHSGGHHLAVVTNHLLGQDGLGGGLLAGGGDDLLAVLGVHGVHDLVVLLVTDLARGLHLAGDTLQLGH